MLKWIRSLVTVTLKIPVYPGIQPDPRELKFEDREAIRQWLSLPTTKLVFSLLEARRPSVFHVGNRVSGDDADQMRASLRLHQLQGWEAYRNTMLTLGMEPDQIQQIVETFNEPSQ